MVGNSHNNMDKSLLTLCYISRRGRVVIRNRSVIFHMNKRRLLYKWYRIYFISNALDDFFPIINHIKSMTGIAHASFPSHIFLSTILPLLQHGKYTTLLSSSNIQNKWHLLVPTPPSSPLTPPHVIKPHSAVVAAKIK